MLKKTVEIGQPEVGCLVRKLRHLMGLSQGQFATALGVAFSTINRWENGHIQPSPLALKQIKVMLNELEDSSIAELQLQSRMLLDQYFAEAESGVND